MSFVSTCSSEVARALNSQSNPVLPFLTLDKYLAIESGGHLCMKSSHINYIRAEYSQEKFKHLLTEQLCDEVNCKFSEHPIDWIQHYTGTCSSSDYSLQAIEKPTFLSHSSDRHWCHELSCKKVKMAVSVFKPCSSILRFRHSVPKQMSL